MHRRALAPPRVAAAAVRGRSGEAIMIIKRRVTRQFVQLDNALVRDRQLALDEHGMLHYLLSLPDDWEVSRAQCARFWGIGRDKAARIFRALRKAGWAPGGGLPTGGRG